MRLVAFLRGINLGKRRVKMADLRRYATEMGLEGVGTHLASGNLVFEAGDPDVPELEKRIETELGTRLGFFTDTVIRPLSRVEELTGHEAVQKAEDEGLNVYVTFAKSELGDEARRAFDALATPDDEFVVLDREVLWLRRGGLSDSAVKTGDLEDAFGGMANTQRKSTSLRTLVERFG